MERAIVLGGGGMTGIGWEVGLLTGLYRGGVDVRAADLVVGTSAGAFVGAVLAGAPDPEEVAARAAADVTAPELPTVDFGLVAQAFAAMNDATLDRAAARSRVGALARSADVGPAETFVAWFGEHLDGVAWPPALRVTAVDTVSGEPVVWNANSGVDLVRAVAASCAVPCVFPPVPVAGSVFMDGGARTVTNADLAAGASAVVVVAPVVGLYRAAPTAELRALGDAAHVLLAPDPAARAAMGDNVFDDSRRALAVAAGLAQGAAAAAAVEPVWDVGGSR